MNNVQLIITAGLLTLFLLFNQLAGGDCAHCYGGLPWYGWTSGFLLLFVAGVVFARWRGERAHRMLAAPPPADDKPPAPGGDARWNEELRRKYDSDGPAFPHPVIVAERCIGCHACVESCPHDVLTISYTENDQPVASVADPELCLEDTSCEAVCPVTPKACIVVNTAKRIKSPPTPPRNLITYESNKVRGCYIIGDVSGMPLIKNAANEGATVMVHLAEELHKTAGRDAVPEVAYEVAIIGAGPAGLSAAVMAARLGLRYVCIEQDTAMSTIVKYSKNKYVFFKPQTTAWTGAIQLPGLEEYVEEVLEEVSDGDARSQIARMLAAERAVSRRSAEQRAESKRGGGRKSASAPEDALAPEIVAALEAARTRYQELLAAEAEDKLEAAASERLRRARARFEALLEAEDKYLLAQLLEAERDGRIEDDPRGKARLAVARRRYGAELEAVVEAGKLSNARFEALTEARLKVAGDQREVLLNTWFLNIRENCVRINEKESCKAFRRAEDGDYFVIQTERETAKGGGAGEAAGDGDDKLKTYRARRLVLAIGNSSSPTKLKVGDEEVSQKVSHGALERERVQYRLSDPRAFVNLRLIVVGGGNSAVEAAVDLVTRREGDHIVFRPPEEQNEVTLLLRGADFKTDVKFGNKQQLYRCIDHGLIKLRRHTEIKEVRDQEVLTTNLLTGRDDPPLRNDFIFALIGSQRPAALLTQSNLKMIE